MTTNIESLFKNADPIVSEILNNALSDKEISEADALRLYNTTEIDFHLVGLVADEIRRRRVGDIVSYVVNRNIQCRGRIFGYLGWARCHRHSPLAALRTASEA